MSLPYTKQTRCAFTLIELLIVVAIIAILAAIAVPNFLEAQVRAKVSRAKSDLRVISGALEAYAVDHNTYPRSNTSSRALMPASQAGNPGYKPTLERLSTPIAYVSGNVYHDPFRARNTYQGLTLETVRPVSDYGNDRDNFQQYWYMARSGENASIWDQNDPRPFWYLLESAGPDGYHHNIGTALNRLRNDDEAELGFILKTVYDPTNGTVSRGSVWRAGGQTQNPGKALVRAIATQR